jgi:D-glycero-D-manno-heptose 1,7-bisphosphate phosphatase
MSIKTIFLDRDGVINKEVNYLYKIDDLEFIDGVFEACRLFKNLGYKIIIITNQAGIAKGLYSLRQFEILNKWILKQFEYQGIKIHDVFLCPHDPQSGCNCRKPKPGMLLEAKNKYDISMGDSWLIGDKETDIEAAVAANIPNTILVRSGHKINEKNTAATYIIDSIKFAKNVINNKTL